MFSPPHGFIPLSQMCRWEFVNGTYHLVAIAGTSTLTYNIYQVSKLSIHYHLRVFMILCNCQMYCNYSSHQQFQCCCLYVNTLHWRHNGRNTVSNHQPHDCLFNRLFRRRSKETSKLRVTGLCVGNSPGTGEFPAQMASNAENVSIWWRHHEYRTLKMISRHYFE